MCEEKTRVQKMRLLFSLFRNQCSSQVLGLSKDVYPYQSIAPWMYVKLNTLQGYESISPRSLTSCASGMASQDVDISRHLGY